MIESRPNKTTRTERFDVFFALIPIKGLEMFVWEFAFCLFISYAYVVVIFLSQVVFVFLLFLGMIICANEVKTKEK